MSVSFSPIGVIGKIVGLAVLGAALMMGAHLYLPKSEAEFRVVQIDPSVIPKSNAVFFFWYGCPHCRKVEEIFRKDSADTKISSLLGDSQALVRIPAPVNPTWEMHARLYYALEHLKVSADTHWFVMNLIQDKGLYTAAKLSAQLQSIADYVVGNNPGVHVTGDNLSNDMNSLKTNQEILSAKILIKAVALKGVPAMLINHRQMIELGSGVGYEDMLPDAIKLLTKPPKS